MLIEHLAGELEKLSTDIEQGKAPFDQQQIDIDIEFFETRINKLEKQIDDLKDKIVNNHYGMQYRRTDTKMKVIEFVLLLYMSGGELIEYTVRDGLSECLSTKRTMERNMTLDPQKKDGVRISCQKLEVKVDDGGNILAFIDD